MAASVLASPFKYSAIKKDVIIMPAVADSGLVPTRAEINAGTNIKYHLDKDSGLSGFTVTPNSVTATDLGSGVGYPLDDGSTYGTASFMCHQDQRGKTYDVRSVFTEGTTYYALICDTLDTAGLAADTFADHRPADRQVPGRRVDADRLGRHQPRRPVGHHPRLSPVLGGRPGPTSWPMSAGSCPPRGRACVPGCAGTSSSPPRRSPVEAKERLRQGYGASRRGARRGHHDHVVRTAGRSVGVSVQVSRRSKLPEGKQGLPPLVEGLAPWKHPLFGDTLPLVCAGTATRS
jgi:hypothetical protein